MESVGSISGSGSFADSSSSSSGSAVQSESTEKTILVSHVRATFFDRVISSTRRYHVDVGFASFTNSKVYEKIISEDLDDEKWITIKRQY